MFFINKKYRVPYFDTKRSVMLCVFNDKINTSGDSCFKELVSFYGKEHFIKI